MCKSVVFTISNRQLNLPAIILRFVIHYISISFLSKHFYRFSAIFFAGLSPSLSPDPRPALPRGFGTSSARKPPPAPVKSDHGVENHARDPLASGRADRPLPTLANRQLFPIPTNHNPRRLRNLWKPISIPNPPKIIPHVPGSGIAVSTMSLPPIVEFVPNSPV